MMQNSNKARGRKQQWPYRGGLSLGERGVALSMVLILSTVSLAIMAALVYMMTADIQVSGIQQRYRTAAEAGRGGGEVTYTIIQYRDVASTETTALVAKLTDMGLNPVVNTSPGCAANSYYTGAPYTGLTAKLNTPTRNWNSSCGTKPDMSVTSSNYDLSFDLGTMSKYRVYAKIVDTVEGNTGGDLDLVQTQVVQQEGGSVQKKPYLYTLEVETFNKDNPQEKAKYSILYEH